MPPIVVTGTAGFIGFHVARRLLADGNDVLGIDNLNDYYDVQLKRDRLALLQAEAGFQFAQFDIADAALVKEHIDGAAPRCVVHLAAQAGVRYSIENPSAYVQANLVGFANVLEACRRRPVEHLVYASSSSVYGANTQMPFQTGHSVDHPVSFYAATKRANELMAHSYSHLFRLPTTGLRFFTVYGPWGRPDMAIYRFTERILADQPIDVYNRGDMRRDFTYIDDAAECVVRLVNSIPAPDSNWSGDAPRPDTSNAPFRVFNLGGNRPVELRTLIRVLEEALGRKAKTKLLAMQLGDVVETISDTDSLKEAIGFEPQTTIEDGVPRFVEWFLDRFPQS